MNFISRLFHSPVTSIGPSEAKQKLDQKPKPFLLDVRQPEEFRSGHIPGAKLIPLGELEQRLNEVPKSQEILCVCHSGNRSRSASIRLIKAGYTVVNLRGGMIAWARAGQKVTKGKA